MPVIHRGVSRLAPATPADLARLSPHFPAGLQVQQVANLRTAQAAPSSRAGYDQSFSYIFDLPVSATKHFLTSHGPSHGTVTLIGGTKPPDVVLVQVTIDVADPEDVTRIHAYQVARADGEVGVAVFTEGSITPHVDFAVGFPSVPQLPLHINSFETRLGQYSHSAVGLDGVVDFNLLSLSADGGARVTSVSGKSISLTSTKGKVEGTDLRSSAIVVAAHDIVNLAVILEAANRTGIASLHATSQTKGGAANLTLTSKDEKGIGGIFDIDINAAGSFTPTVSSAPIDSTLRLEVSAKGTVHAMVWPSFEGDFALSSDRRVAYVNDDPIEDPTGKKRQWSLQQKYIVEGKRLEGRADWVPPARTNPRGSIKIASKEGKSGNVSLKFLQN